jgi:cell wall-associated NlpC family hydrolase
MHRNWLATAALTATAISVPIVAGTGTAQAATSTNGQQTAIANNSSRHRVDVKVAPIHVAIKPYIGRHRRPGFNQRAARYAKTLEGIPYVYGGTTPAGFDCSGLSQYVYRHLGKHIRRTAEDQFLQFRRVSHRRARPGDLVFFHDSSDPSSYVYHVGVYEGGNNMVAETSTGGYSEWQDFSWAGDTVTFGTISH